MNISQRFESTCGTEPVLSIQKTSTASRSVAIAAALLCCSLIASPIQAQTKLTYPELNTALKTKLPNRSFANKSELVEWLITQIRRRKVDKPLTVDREDDLRQAGATEELITAIRANSPPPAVSEPPLDPVDLGDLIKHAVDLVKPEYTPEALQAGTTGEVKLTLELDEQGRVTSVSRLSMLPNGLTERAIEAARQSTFKPAERNGKPARGSGVITYSFKINLNIAATLSAANDLRDKRECDRAIAEYSKVIAFDAKNSKALFGRGSCHLIKGDYQNARSDIESAAELDPNDPEMAFHLGIVLDFLAEHSGAASTYARALRLRPGYDEQPAFGCLFIDRIDPSPDKARIAANDVVKNCDQALKTANAHLASLLIYKRGIGYRLKGEYEKAVTDFENVRRSNPSLTSVNMQFVVLYNNRGLEAFNKKDYKKAYDDITLAIQADPRNPTPYINRCTIYLYGWKQYDNAIKDCSEAIRLETRSSTAYIHRGFAYESKKSFDEAAADYQRALQIDPKSEAARSHLARIRPKVPSLRDQ